MTAEDVKFYTWEAGDREPLPLANLVESFKASLDARGVFRARSSPILTDVRRIVLAAFGPIARHLYFFNAFFLTGVLTFEEERQSFALLRLRFAVALSASVFGVVYAMDESLPKILFSSEPDFGTLTAALGQVEAAEAQVNGHPRHEIALGRNRVVVGW
jgi:hypothetical protein